MANYYVKLPAVSGSSAYDPEAVIAALTPQWDFYADDLVGADGTQVSTWTDRTGNGFNLAKQGTTGPALYNNVTAFGGRKVVRCPQSTQRTMWNQTWTPTGSGAFAITLVLNTPLLVSGAQGAFCLGTSGNPGEVLQGGLSLDAPVNTQGLVLTDRNSNLYNLMGSPAGAIQFHVITIVHLANGDSEAWVDGIRRNSVNLNLNISGAGFSICGSNVEAAYHYGDLGRAMLMPYAPTYTQTTALSGALISIYGG